MKKSEKIVWAIVAVVIVVFVALAPKTNVKNIFTAGGGLSLKELNERGKDSTAVSVNVSLQANQTSMQNLEQAMIIGSLYRQHGYWYAGANFIGCASTEYGICSPVTSFNFGMKFNCFDVDYKIGNFGRNKLTTSFVDPQYGNFCINLGEGASIQNAMQLSLIAKHFTFGLGHYGGEKFYDFATGRYYAFVESNICRYLALSGGMDINNSPSGYAAAKVTVKNNVVSVSGNKLGSENQNLIASYSRTNIAVGKKAKAAVTASGWLQGKDKGLHLVASLNKGCYTLFAQSGIKNVSPYFGLGGSVVF